MADHIRWAGVDVGGCRKGFHGVVLGQARILAGPQRLPDPAAVVDWLVPHAPAVVALDSPRTCAPEGEHLREGERKLMKEICGIRWTPEESRLAGNAYFEWIVNGRKLYGALADRHPEAGWEVIGVFPTASWTIWAGKRGASTRARWTREALERLSTKDLPARRLNQDDRDAVAAALTARLYTEQRTKAYGEIEVPTERP